MVVRDDRARRLAPAAKRLLKERFGGCSIAVLAQQHVDDLAVLVDGAVQVPLVVAAKEEHLVDVPVATERPTVFASFSRQLRPECLDPAQYGPVRHVDAPLGRSSITLLPEAGGAGTDARPSGSRRRANDSPRRPRRTLS